MKNNTTGELHKPLHRKSMYNSVYNEVVNHDGKQVGITLDVHGFCGPSRRATNALAPHADIATVQGRLGHANVSTTRIDDTRRSRPEERPTCKVAYCAA